MKKMIVVLFLFFLLISNVRQSSDFTLKDFVKGEYTIYTKNKVNENSIFLGTCYMTNDVVQKEEIIGESVKTTNTELVSLLNVLDAKIIQTEYLDCGAVVISAFSPFIEDTVEVDNKKMNLQIASYSDYSIIGWPVIFGSF